ncbi:MAG: hypothetical protein MZV63_46245 [Marinilabiliales bacterium]|nr:hypothetical protein [Marinilabiliales bacterium]
MYAIKSTNRVPFEDRSRDNTARSVSEISLHAVDGAVDPPIKVASSRANKYTLPPDLHGEEPG